MNRLIDVLNQLIHLRVCQEEMMHEEFERGQREQSEHFIVTREMAHDAGFPEMEGMLW